MGIPQEIKDIELKTISRLTPRQYQVLVYASHGFPYKEIATFMYIRPQTVKNHASDLCHRLKVSNMTHAVAIALRQNMID